jgi:arabinofuranan 3-O-arabinosyltransferase
VEVAERTSVDPRFGEITVLPSGIAEIRVPGADDPVELPETIESSCRDDLLTLGGGAVPLSFSAPADALLTGEPIRATVCGGLVVEGGDVHLRSTPGRVTGLDVDRVVVRPGEPGPAPAARPVTEVVESGRLDRTVALTGCAEGCWLVLGEGFNEAWSASVDDDDLGASELVDGGFNGWWLPPGADARTVSVRWTAQGTLDLAFALSILTVIASVALIAVSLRRRRREESVAPPALLAAFDPVPRVAPDRTVLLTAVVWIASCALLVDWMWGAAAAVSSILLFTYRRPEALAWAGWAGFVAVGVAMVALQRTRTPFPNGGWPLEFSELHEVTLFAVITFVVGVSVPSRALEGPSPTIDRP